MSTQLAAPPSTTRRRPPTTDPGTDHGVGFHGLGRVFPASEASSTSEPHVVLRDLDLSVQPSEVVAILGPSGCGKSTLLRITAGLDQPTTGEVRIGGTAIAGIDPRCAFAFQEPRLLP